MTVDAALVNKANRFLTSTQATTAYTDYNAIAKAILDKDNPGLSTTLYDWCHAQLICHLWAIGDPNAGLKSFTTGDFSGSQDAGSTIWWLAYRQTIEDFQSDSTADSETTVGRCDAEMPEMRFDQSIVPRYYVV
jgi:hypothetical protein